MIKKSVVRFKSSKLHLLKKISLSVVIIAIAVFFAIKVHWLSNLILFLFTGLPIIINIARQPAEGKGFWGKMLNFYKNLFRKYLVDELPVKAVVNNEQLEITLHKAERINFKTVNKTFIIKKDDMIGVLYDEVSDDVLILFNKANINIYDAKSSKLLKQTSQHSATICFSIHKKLSIVEKMFEYKFPIEKLSEIEDVEQEVDDPELFVNKMYAEYNKTQEGLKELKEENRQKRAEKRLQKRKF